MLHEPQSHAGGVRNAWPVIASASDGGGNHVGLGGLTSNSC